MILSGGNDLSKINKRKEKFLEIRRKKFSNIVLIKNTNLGVCQGFQLIASLFNYSLKKCKGHMKKHKLNLNDRNILTQKI